MTIDLEPQSQASVPELGTVQETLLTPLCARADQVGRPDAIVDDPTAAKMVASIDYDFNKIRCFHDTMVGCAIRAARFDRWIKSFLDGPKPCTLVLIGEGLDTTFERNDDGESHWFELDFPDVISLRRRLFEPNGRRTLIAGDVFDRDWIERVRNAGTSRHLFQIAGVLMYLPPDRVRELFIMLAEEFPGCTVLFDTCSELAKRHSGRWEASVRTTRAKYQWGINDARRIGDWDDRIRVTDVEYTLDYHRHQWRPSTRFWSAIYRPLRHAYQLNRAVMRA